jgi:HEAT repeat protein
MKNSYCAPCRPVLFVIIAGLLLSLFASAAVSAAKPPTLNGAKWIWHKGAGKAAGTWYFQKGFAFPAGQKPKSARLLITCDNLWTLHINGTKIAWNASPDSWSSPRNIDVTGYLMIEKNAIAIKGQNTAVGPSGLLVKLVVEFEDGKKTFEMVSDKTWISASKPCDGWNENGFTAGSDWTGVTVIGDYGIAPWGKVKVGAKRKRPPPKPIPLLDLVTDEKELKKPVYQAGAVFVGSAVGLNVNRQPIYHQNIRGTRAYFEMDPMTPAALGRQLWSVIPLRPDGKKTLLCDAGKGTIGSPSVSYDGKTVYFTMVKPDEAYFHIYKIDMTAKGDAAPGGKNSVVQVTDGPFHDYDPMELPDGRIAFSSTRIGSREEYHAKYASSLHTYNPKTKFIRPLTYHIVADREPRVTSDGSLVFIRSDNFLERAKVEAHLHQTRLDGTAGQVIIGPGRKGIRLDRDVAAEPAMNWLRRYGMGSPAPMPNGRVAAINQTGLVTSATATGLPIGKGFLPFDLSPLPDGRLLCTSKGKSQIIVFDPKDPTPRAVYSMPGIHSVVHLGARKRPSIIPSMVDPAAERRIDKTGFLYCQNVLNTQHTSADTKRIRAIRVYEGRPFTLEPTKTIYAHIGTIGVELGTVPLAEDGSFYIEVPADRPVALQAIDGEGRAVINELSWIYTRPGEQRACVGCHAPVDAAPKMTVAKAMRTKPLKLTGQGTPHRFRANNGANGGIVNLQLDKFREVVGVNLMDIPNDTSLSTIRRLGILRNRSSVPVLVKALAGKSPEMRCAAALSLSACGNRDAVKPLMELLKDNNATVARAAAVALEHLTGNPEGGTDWAAIEKALILKVAAKDDRQEVHMAVEALGHVGGDAGRKAIRDWLKSNPKGELRMMMAAIRSLGHLQDRKAIPDLVAIMNANMNLRGKGGWNEGGFNQKPTYLSATAAEALGRIGGADVEKAILASLAKQGNFETQVMHTGEHGWLRSAQASPSYFRMLEALERMGSKAGSPLAGQIVESIQSDKDRGLLYELDTYEKLVGRTIKRIGRMDDVVEACLAVLGDKSGKTKPDAALTASVSKAPHNERHIRRHSAQARSAQVLSIVCMDLKYADRIRSVLKTWRADKPSETRAWACFMLTRTLGRLGDTKSIDLFAEMLDKDPTEASLGLNPPPAHIIYKAWRPFYRPAAAWSLGQLKAKKATGALIKAVQQMENASSTRQQAAIALGEIADKTTLAELKKIAEEYPELMTRRSLLTSVKKMMK